MIKMPRLPLFLVVILIALAVVGCSPVSGPAPAPSGGLSPSPIVPPPFEPYLITDPDQLSQFWDEYARDIAFDAINGFTSVDELPYHQLISFCTVKMLQNNEPDVENIGGSFYSVPISLLSQYLERYFDIKADEEQCAEMAGYSYDPSSGRYSESVYISPELYDSGILRMSELRRAAPDRLEATLIRYNSFDLLAQPDKFALLTFNLRPDGSLYMVSSDAQWYPTQNLFISGRYSKVPSPADQAIADMHYWQPMGHNLMLGASVSYDRGYDPEAVVLCIFDSQNARLNATTRIEIDGSDNYTGAKIYDDRIIIRTRDKIFVLDHSLNMLSSIDVPSFLGEDSKDRYDVNRDLSLILYSDDEGCHVSALDGSDKRTLALHPNYSEQMKNDDILSIEAFSPVAFVDNEKAVLLTHGGYEMVLGYQICPLDGSDPIVVDILAGYDSQFYYDDQTMLIVGGYSPSGEEYKRQSLKVTFSDGLVTPVGESMGEMADNLYDMSLIAMGRYLYYFEVSDANSPYDISAQLKRIDLMTGTNEPMRFAVTGFSYISFLGENGSGDILIKAQYNGELALCVVRG